MLAELVTISFPSCIVAHSPGSYFMDWRPTNIDIAESKEGKKTLYEFPNKYFVMYGDAPADKPTAELRCAVFAWPML